jgi:hypothetical protein
VFRRSVNLQVAFAWFAIAALSPVFFDLGIAPIPVSSRIYNTENSVVFRIDKNSLVMLSVFHILHFKTQEPRLQAGMLSSQLVLRGRAKHKILLANFAILRLMHRESQCVK